MPDTIVPLAPATSEIAPPFAGDYRTARALFLAGAEAAGAELVTHENPAPGPDGLPVQTDVALLGDPNAGHVLLINTATHGVEGFCGSGALVGWLDRFAGPTPSPLPDDVRLVAIHAINPHGFAWVRRVTEDNVDLNRNFMDHAAKPWPKRPEYGAIHQHLVPESWDDATLARHDKALEAYAEKHGAYALQSAATGGQYDHADGLFYGGRKAGWSNRTFRRILDDHVKGASRIAFLDIHTGLGPYGYASLLGTIAPRMKPYLSSRGATLGNFMAEPPKTQGGLSAPLTGVIGSAVRGIASGAEMTSLTIEFGTYPIREVLRALQADNWLHLHGDVDSAQGRTIKAGILEHLFPQDSQWREMVALRSRQLLDRTAEGLGAA